MDSCWNLDVDMRILPEIRYCSCVPELKNVPMSRDGVSGIFKDEYLHLYSLDKLCSNQSLSHYLWKKSMPAWKCMAVANFSFFSRTWLIMFLDQMQSIGSSRQITFKKCGSIWESKDGYIKRLSYCVWTRLSPGCDKILADVSMPPLHNMSFNPPKLFKMSQVWMCWGWSLFWSLTQIGSIHSYICLKFQNIFVSTFRIYFSKCHKFGCVEDDHSRLRLALFTDLPLPAFQLHLLHTSYICFKFQNIFESNFKIYLFQIVKYICRPSSCIFFTQVIFVLN